MLAMAAKEKQLQQKRMLEKRGTIAMEDYAKLTKDQQKKLRTQGTLDGMKMGMVDGKDKRMDETSDEEETEENVEYYLRH